MAKSIHCNEFSRGDVVPSAAAMVEDIIGCKWSLRLLRGIASGHRRPSAVQRACPGLSAKVMNERLGKMMRYGILDRTVFGDKPPVQVEYALTRFGHRFMRVVAEVDRLQDAVGLGQAQRREPGR